MPWFTYNQNNSGGNFVFDAEKGITHFVVIEAAGQADADARAEAIGLYFNGCYTGNDCSCCGDRWYPAYDKGTPKPTIYGEPAAKYSSSMLWMKPNPEVFIHPLRGKFRAVQGKYVPHKSLSSTKSKKKVKK